MDICKLRAFVIGPIGDRDAEVGSSARDSYEGAIEVFEYIIVQACKALDIEAYRADQISRAGEINEQIFRSLRDAHIVIADLTDANPNVMYELGLRHTTGKLTIQVGEKGRLPFDISTIRTILFKRSDAGFISARRSLIAALAEGLEQGSDPVTATRIWLETPGTKPGESELASLGDEPGFLEQLADTEVGLMDVTQTAERGSSILEEITQVMRRGTERIQSLPAVGNYSSAKLAAANMVAEELRDPSVRLNIVAQDFESHVERITPGLEYMLQEGARDPEQLNEAPDFLKAIYTLISVAEESAANAERYAESLKVQAAATRMMRKVADSIRQSAMSMAQTFRKIASWRELANKINMSESSY